MRNKLLANTLLFLTLLMGCEDGNKNTPSITEEGQIWQQHPSFYRLDKILLNANVYNDSLYVVGVDRVSIFDTTSENPVINGSLGNFYNPLTLNIPIMGGQLFAMPNNNAVQVIVYSAAFLRGNESAASYPFVDGIQLSSYNLNYTDRAQIAQGSYSQRFGALNAYNQLLMLMDDSTDNCYNCYTSFALIDLNPETSSGSSDFPYLTISPIVRRIPFASGVSVGFNDIIAYKQKFLISISDNETKLGIIDTAGNFSSNPIQQSISSFFIKDDTLFAFSYPGELYRSTDGNNWSLWLENLPYARLRFFTVNDKICFYIYSQLFWLDAANLNLVELDNEGLQSNEINSVNVFHNKVYITTLSGLFTKPLEHFFDEKPESASKPKSRHITIQDKKLKITK